MQRFVRAMNRVPAMLLRSPLHGLMSGGVLLLAFTGRRSGKRYETPINYVREGDAVLMTTDSPWWRNLRRGEGETGAPVTLRIEGREHAGVAEAVTDEEEVIAALEKMLKRFPRYGRYADVSLGPDGRINRREAEEAVRGGRVLIRVALAGRREHPRG